VVILPICLQKHADRWTAYHNEEEEKKLLKRFTELEQILKIHYWPADDSASMGSADGQ
jgi:hypothetical protein